MLARGYAILCACDSVENRRVRLFYLFIFILQQGNRNERADERYSHSELLLYKNLALSDAGMTQEALDHLEACHDKVLSELLAIHIIVLFFIFYFNGYQVRVTRRHRTKKMEMGVRAYRR